MRALASLSEPLADWFRRALLVSTPTGDASPADGPGVIVFTADGGPESLSPAAENWIGQMTETPRLRCRPNPCPRTAFNSRRAWAGLATEPRSKVSATSEAFHWIWPRG